MLNLFANAKPFLKWAGGKTQLLDAIARRMPYSHQASFTYIEPFVGGGSVLFWILNNYPNVRNVVINDINADLINTYRCIAQDVDAVIEPLKKWQKLYDTLSEKPKERSKFYYSQRELYNSRTSDNTTQAALFIFLNKTCFNGLYRVNRKNMFNVPIGSYKNPTICDETNLLIVHERLQNVEILHGDYEIVLEHVTEETFVYLDPPYKPISKTSSFNAYSHGVFNDSEQVRLKEFCDLLDAKGCKWLLSNSDVKTQETQDEFFDSLYSNHNVSRVMANRAINSKASGRGKLSELLIANFGERF